MGGHDAMSFKIDPIACFFQQGDGFAQAHACHVGDYAALQVFTGLELFVTVGFGE